MSDQSDQLPDTTTHVLNASKDSLTKLLKATVVLMNENKLNAEKYGKQTKSQVFSGVKRKPRRLPNPANKVKTPVHSGPQEREKLWQKDDQKFWANMYKKKLKSWI